MTFAAGGVTGCAVIPKHLFERGMIFGDVTTARIKHSPVTLLGGVERKLISGCHITVALTAIFFGLRAWAGDQPLVCGCLVRRFNAAVTFGTGNLTVRGGQEGTCVY
jgi:hypothetical protein